MSNNPLVTISIPTYNSQKHIDICLKAIKKQTYRNIQINIIDGNSKDRTVEIAKKNGVKDIFYCEGSLMESRLIGAKKAKGEHVLILDSDQVLEKDAISRCVAEFVNNDIDVVFLGEDVYKKKTVVELLFHMDRKLVHAIGDTNPYTSVLLPRFFKKSLLLKAYAKIPEHVIKKASPQDHAILYLETWRLTKKIGMVKNAVKHIEADTLHSLWKKYYRWGFYSTRTDKTGYEKYFAKRTERFRVGMFRKDLFFESVASIILLLLKGIPYKAGYYKSLLEKEK